MKEEFLELKNEISALKLELKELREEFENYKRESSGTGVYLDGCPEYAKEYIQRETGIKSKKED